MIKEWINLLIEQLFAEEKGIFEQKVNEEIVYTFHPQADPELCFFAGLIVGKALEEGVPISAKLNRLLLKELI